MKHVFQSYNSGIESQDNPFHPFLPDEWSQHTSVQMRMYWVQNLPDPHGPAPVPSGPISSTRPKGYSPAATGLMGFEKGIKREIAAYSSLKDERYFDCFKTSLFIVAKSHKCNEVLDPPILQAVHLIKRSSWKLNKLFCSVSSIRNFKLTWVRPLSEDTWTPLMVSQYGESSVSI